MKNSKLLNNLIIQVEQMIDERVGSIDENHGHYCMHPANMNLVDNYADSKDKYCALIDCAKCVFQKGNLDALKNELNELSDLINIVNI